MRITLSALFVCANLVAVQAETWQRVAYDDAGATGKQTHSHLLRGSGYRYTETDLPETVAGRGSPARTVAFGEPVMFGYSGLVPAAKYRLRLLFQSDGDREERVTVGNTIALDRVVLKKGPAVKREVDIPPRDYADGTLTVRFDKLAGPNAIVSEIEVLSTDKTPLTKVDRSILVSKEDRQMAYELVDKLRPRYTPLPFGGKTPVSLNGWWSFCPAPEEGFEGQTAAGTGWQPIEVPGEWTMQGFTVPPNQSAGYWREFHVPDAWIGNRIRLRFDAVYSDCTVWVNALKVGGHLGGFTPFEVDITEAVQAGRNTLALSVKNESVADALASGTQYAAHVLGGISRKVTLFALPPVHIQSLHVIGALDEACRHGNAIVQVEVANADGRDVSGLGIRCSVFSVQQPSAPRGKLRRQLEPLGPGETFVEDLDVSMPGVLTWHPEHPNLYMARVDLMRDELIIETVERRFGFRRVDVRGNQLLVNNVPVQLKGVCRHEVHPLRGRSLPEGQWRRDIEVFRAGNVNHIRTSHYPPSEELMTAADELGMFIEAEGPFCWAHNAKGSPDAIREATVRQMLELVERDRSHPCVIYWSLANESNWNRHFEMSSLAVRELDPTRPQTFNFFPWGQAASRPDEGFCEVGSDHYPGPGGPSKYADHVRPICYGEYCHLNAYNRHELVTDPGVRDAWGRGLAAMWASMWLSPGTLGGSLWAGIDDTFYVPPDLTVGYGTWGPIDGWRRPKPEYWHMKKVYSPVRVLTQSVDVSKGAATIVVELDNRFDATHLKDVKIEAQFERPQAEWLQIRADVPPRTSGAMRVPVQAADRQAKTLRLRFTSPLGFVVDEYAVPVSGETVSAEAPSQPDTILLMDSGDRIGVTTGGRTWTVSRTNGQLSCTGVVLGGPHLMVLPLNGAGGTQMHGKLPTYAPYTFPCVDWKTEAVTAEAHTGGVQVVVSGSYKDARGEFVLSVDGWGRVSVTYEFVMREKVNPRQVGIVLDLPRTCDRLEWERDGLWTVYPEDHIGRLRGTVRAFEGMHACGPAGPRVKPDWPWSMDGNELGSNDFRSTKSNIRRASLTGSDGQGIAVVSDGSQHVRAWVEGGNVRLLVADYSNPGAERFFRSHAAKADKPLQKGDVVRGTVVFRTAR